MLVLRMKLEMEKKVTVEKIRQGIEMEKVLSVEVQREHLMLIREGKHAVDSLLGDNPAVGSSWSIRRLYDMSSFLHYYVLFHTGLGRHFLFPSVLTL